MGLIDRLPFPPQQDESLHGLLMRLADDNLCSAKEFCSWLDMPFPSLMGFEFRQAAVKLGVDPSVLTTLRHAAMPLETPVASSTLSCAPASSAGGDLSVGPFMRWCPLCLEERPYHRRMWHHRQLQACPHHGVVLSDRCAACVEEGHVGVTWWTSVGVARCVAGHALERQAPGDSVADCTGAAAVYRACGVSCPGAELPPDFAALSAAQLVESLLALGRLKLVVVNGNRLGLHGRDMARDHRVLEAGAQIALGWPDAFHVLATEIRAAYSKTGRLSEQYGQLHRLVASGGAPGFIRDAYANHLRGREDAGELDWPLFLPKPPEAVGSVTRSEARQMLGLGGNSFAKLLKTEMWNDVEVVLSTREGLEYRRSDVLRLKARLERLVTPDALDHQLGVGSGHGAALCNAGLLATVPWNRHARNSVKVSVDVGDAMALFQRVCSIGLSEPPHEAVSFATLVRSAANRQVVNFADLMRQIVIGRPRGFLAHPDRPGFQGLVFEKDDAVRVLNELSTPDASGLVLLGDLARQVRIPPAAIRAMAEADLLYGYGTRRRNVFPASMATWISSRFVCDRDLSEGSGLTAAEVGDKLASSGIRPVVEVDIPGKGLAAVYIRVEAEGAAGPRPVTVQPKKRKRVTCGPHVSSRSTLPSL